MAVMIPDAPRDFHGSPGESAVFDALRTLDDRCWVFHSLRWLAEPRAPGAAQGEGDFVVLDPNCGLLVIEVKSGGIHHPVYHAVWFPSVDFPRARLPLNDQPAMLPTAPPSMIQRRPSPPRSPTARVGPGTARSRVAR